MNIRFKIFTLHLRIVNCKENALETRKLHINNLFQKIEIQIKLPVNISLELFYMFEETSFLSFWLYNRGFFSSFNYYAGRTSNFSEKLVEK